MTRAEAKTRMKRIYNDFDGTVDDRLAMSLAIKALSQEPTDTWSIKDVADAFKKHGLLREQEPCDDAISRQVAIDTIESWLSCDDYNETERHIMRAMQSVLYDLPSVTQKSGKWILLDECANSGYYCSNCQKKLVKEGWSQTVKKIKYCPNCGAKMESEE